MKKTVLMITMFVFSFTVQALPLLSVKDQLREELWHLGFKKQTQVAKSEPKKNQPTPRLNEELSRALGKYQL